MNGYCPVCDRPRRFQYYIPDLYAPPIYICEGCHVCLYAEEIAPVEGQKEVRNEQKDNQT
jgi:hypothetical protein